MNVRAELGHAVLRDSCGKWLVVEALDVDVAADAGINLEPSDQLRRLRSVGGRTQILAALCAREWDVVEALDTGRWAEEMFVLA